MTDEEKAVIDAAVALLCHFDRNTGAILTRSRERMDAVRRLSRAVTAMADTKPRRHLDGAIKHKIAKLLESGLSREEIWRDRIEFGLPTLRYSYLCQICKKWATNAAQAAQKPCFVCDGDGTLDDHDKCYDPRPCPECNGTGRTET